MTAASALIFLPFVTTIAIWVAWSDMSSMKIPNKAVIALGTLWVVLGAVAGLTTGLGVTGWLWGFALGAAILCLGFIVTMAGLVGAGDAKFAAVMAPFFVGADLRQSFILFAACLLGAFATHRLARIIPPLRRATPHWASWTHSKFPMGLALSGTLVFHLLSIIFASSKA